MKKWRLIVGVALVFILGVMAGSVGTRLYQRSWAERFWGDPAARKALFLKKLTKELGLSEKQQKEFKVIIDDMDVEMGMRHRENRAAIRAILDKGFSHMMERLDPAQQEKLKELKVRREKRLKDGRRRRWP